MLGADRYRALFSNRAVALLVAALVFSRIGDQFVAIGLLWATLEITHSAAAAGVVLAAYTTALIIAGIGAASLLDRYPRKPLMLLDNAARAICIGGLAWAGIAHTLTLPLLVGLSLVAGFASAITVVGTRAYLPTLVPEELLTSVFAVDSTLYQVAAIAGPALAGLVTARFGASWSLATGAACFVLFVLVAAAIPAGALDEGIPPEARPLSVNDELLGARFILTNPVLRGVTALTVIANFFFGICIVGLAFLSRDVFGRAAGGQGIMLTALAVGALLAGIWLGAGHWHRPRGLSFIGVNVLIGVLAIAIGLAPTILLACALLVAFGAADAAFFIWMSEMRQRTPPPELLARVISASMILNVVSVPFASAVTGFAVTGIGVRPMFVVAGAALALCAALFLRDEALRQAP